MADKSPAHPMGHALWKGKPINEISAAERDEARAYCARMEQQWAQRRYPMSDAAIQHQAVLRLILMELDA